MFRRKQKRLGMISALTLMLLGGCYEFGPSSGGGQIRAAPERRVNAADIQLPPGYRIEPIVTGLNFPTGVAIDDQGKPYVIEAGYCYGEVWMTPRLLRIENGKATEIARGDAPPCTGVASDHGNFYVAEGGEKDGGKIIRITPDGKITALVENLPSLGDHHTNGPAILVLSGH